jgi:hypothetical protein
MPPELSIKQRFRRTILFFPIQLVWVNLKKNHFMILIWLFLFGIITSKVLVKYGIPALFLYPEYLNEVDFKSHLILGFAVGGIVMAYNITSYIMNGFRFPFIATLARPFIKYCINNFIVPVAFVAVYSYQLFYFQLNSELETIDNVVINLLSFWAGILSFLFISTTYFLSTNKDIFKFIGIKTTSNKGAANPVQGVFHRKEKWHKVFNQDREWDVETYFSSFTKISLARKSEHYDRDMLKKVFSQNHVNASLFEIIIIATIFTIGYFREYSYFEIPSAASIILFLTMALMLMSAVYSWLKGWATTVFITLLLLANYSSKKEVFNYTNYAYGMDYKTTPALYNNTVLDSIHSSNSNTLKDFHHHLEILNNWRLKNNSKKPKLIIVNTSGGGMRSATWTVSTLQHLDSLFNGRILKQTHLISGSSGGMIGAAYLREIYRRSQTDSSYNIYDKKLVKNISQDALNPLAIALVTNDMVVRTQSFEDNNNFYTKDRGYAFEKELNANTENVLNKRIADYQDDEYESKIPLMILAPTITNDGRRLYITPQPISFLTQKSPKENIDNNFITDGIEFSRFFKKQDSDSLRFTTALRMSASFPYIMPAVSLPSKPQIHVLDAGIRDNFGHEVTMHYLFTFRNWINTNTSGVIIIQLRDKPKNTPMKENSFNTIAQNLSTPLGTFYGNWENIQNYRNDEIILYSSQWFQGKIDVIDFELQNQDKDYISLSWHLTNKEKRQIKKAINLPNNQESISKLKSLLE